MVELKPLNDRRDVAADREGRIWRRGTGGRWLKTDEMTGVPVFDDELDELDDEPEAEPEIPATGVPATFEPATAARPASIRRVRFQGGPLDAQELRAEPGEAFADGAVLERDGGRYVVDSATGAALYQPER